MEFIRKTVKWLVILIGLTCLGAASSSADSHDVIVLDASSERIDLYEAMYMVKDRDGSLSIDDVTADEFDRFEHHEEIEQQKGFFESETWLRFEVLNDSNHKDWLLEFAFPLIYELEIYKEEQGEWVHQAHTGATSPFQERDYQHRYFVFDLDVEPGERQVYYAKAVGGGDLHPPINIWDQSAFMEKTQNEIILLGIFYGIVIVMIFYNLFLYFSLRMRSYLYYVLVITFTLLGKLSINGLGYQYLWPEQPEWNLISTPFWVSLGCIFILLFTKAFLDVNQYISWYKYVSAGLIIWHLFVILFLYVSHYIALNMMVVGAFTTFSTVLIVAFICLKKGARQARFYIVGWVIFLTGVFITILERAAIVPYNAFTEYAGQMALSIEVVLLSLALADKINIIRKEKDEAEKKAQESQILAMEHLKNADVLKNEFLALTSHELRTPLFGMIGIAESLKDGVVGPVSSNMKNQLLMIIKSGNRLVRLVDDILDFSKLQHESLNVQLKPVDVKGVVDVVVAISQPLIKDKSVKLITDIPEQLPPVKADPNRLQQILHNLVDNAIKHTEEGEIVLSVFEKEDGMVFTVKDKGRGIAEDELESIFDPFYQVHQSSSRDISGSGIGLSITKRLVELHDGEIDVQSELGVGTTFYVMIPKYQDKRVEAVNMNIRSLLVPDDPTVQKTYKDITRPRGQILVADDEAVNLQVLTNQLSLEGYEVLTATNGEEVFEIVHREELDLIILDIMMPKMSGYEICRRLREDYSLMDLPILMLTAKNQLEDKIVSFEAGANDYLVKPCDKQELLSRVRSLVRISSLNKQLTQLNVNLEHKVKERTQSLEETNQKLQKVNEELEDMTQSRREMLANIAHELGSPVALIYNYLQSLGEGTIATDNKHYREMVSQKINVLNRLISDLYDLAKLESGQASMNKKTVHLVEWLSQINDKCAFIVRQSGKTYNGIVVTEEFEYMICMLDEERMDQVFSNLLSNAIKNTDENGEIAIDGEIDQDKLILTIRDNGYGIPEEELPHIFSRFYKGYTHNNYINGTGLGLSIVKEIIHHHDAAIHVRSRENVGTTFFIEIPVTSKVTSN
ncbi:ATP-binding protein [Aquisalibacillus elongatus]|uniref:ATP-binding protein n=1 Tax=Aquisalibacillus elongatus TaxID=485577 RepID=UPI001FE8CD63|nr:ATP-binding protein [Aquisalibacillus elongatus]